MKSEVFNWHRCKKDGAFFIPSLDPHGTRARGLGEGYRQLGRRAVLYGKVGAFRGMLGVMFSRRSL